MKGRLFLSGFPAMLALEVIMQLRMPLVARSRMNSPSFLTSNLVRITISLSSSNLNGMNIPETNYIRFYQNGWSPFIPLFNQTRRDCCFSLTYWSLTCNSFIFLLKGDEPNFVSPATNPFHWNIFYFSIRIWLISERNKSTSMEIRWRCCSKTFLRTSSSTFWKRLIFSTSCSFFDKKYTLFLFFNVWLYEWTNDFWYDLFDLMWCR